MSRPSATDTAAPEARPGLRGRVQRLWALLESPRMLDLSLVLILGSALVLTVIGLMMVLSASSIEGIGSSGGSYGLFIRQLGWAGVGLVAMIGMMFLPVRVVRWMAWPAIALAVVLLALVAFTPLGHEVNGNLNWIRIGGFQAQPSEAAKLAVVIWAAAVLERKRRLVGEVKHTIVPVIFPVGLAVLALIMRGRDLGTALIILVILAAVLLVAGAHRVVFFVAAGLGAAATLGLTLLAPHRMLRVQAWLGIQGACDHPSDPCFQPSNGLFALASGGWWGLGPGQSRQKWSYIPEAENDFVFTILGEELGLMGTTLVIALFAAMAVGMYVVATQTRSPFIRIATWGVIAWLVGQAFLNIAMVSGVLPVVGVPLPFISYGGSALTFALMAVGIVVAFARHERARLRDQDGGRARAGAVWTGRRARVDA